MASSKNCRWESLGKEGKGMPLYICSPVDEQPHGAVILLQEIFGVNRHMMDVAERVMSEGYAAVVPDLFWRHGPRITNRYDEVQKGLERVSSLTEETFLADMDDVLGKLKSEFGVSGQAVGVLGFCMGGRLAYLTAATKPLGAAVSFYGGGIVQGPLKRTEGIQCPVLLLFGGKDKHISKSDVEAIRSRLAAADKHAEVVVYPEAEHGFFCDERASYNEAASNDAWERVLNFFSKNL
ncbi:MAG: dienelactone hydrolase family protein [Deltaproteobacteria bacterium]|nr:dienelactone hydrolase family protein [Deltaproteobacteria bacterium]